MTKASAEKLANEIKRVINVIPKRKFDLNPSDPNEDLFFGPDLPWPGQKL